MTKWLFSLLMIFALGSGVFAGAPLKSSDKECAMSKTMKCCKRDAVGQKTSTEVSAASLCRALFCEQSGTTTSSVRIPQFSALVFAVAYLQTLKFLPVHTKTLPKTDFHTVAAVSDAYPLYLQNLSFRI